MAGLMGMGLDMVLEYVLVWLAGIATIAVLVALAPKRRDPEKERLKERVEELERELREQREHYERLLRDAAVKNAMMTGLWSAYRSGELHACYREGGRVRVLADGTVLCEGERDEESYAIRPRVETMETEAGDEARGVEP